MKTSYPEDMYTFLRCVKRSCQYKDCCYTPSHSLNDQSCFHHAMICATQYLEINAALPPASFTTEQGTAANNATVGPLQGLRLEFSACGCALLASDGVCVLSNLNELKNDQIQELENVVQTERVNIDIPKKYIGCQQSQISVPVTCKIWACCETTKKQGRSHCNTYQNLQEYGQSFSKTLVEYVRNFGIYKPLMKALSWVVKVHCHCYFSLVFVMTENEIVSSETFAENLIVKSVLGRACQEEEQENGRVSESEYLEFLQYASRTEPSFSNEAQALIQGFYLASRRARSSSGISTVEFPIAALKSMMSLAEAHAKLSLRDEVSENDAVVAILLYEESITARVGYSVLGITPIHHFKDENVLTYIGEENDEKMIHLKLHIKRFCSLHSNYKYTPGYVPREE